MSKNSIPVLDVIRKVSASQQSAQPSGTAQVIPGTPAGGWPVNPFSGNKKPGETIPPTSPPPVVSVPSAPVSHPFTHSNPSGQTIQKPLQVPQLSKEKLDDLFKNGD